MVAVAGEDASATRLRERIDFTSNILFFVEDLFLTLGPGYVTTQAGSKINVVSSLLWIRNQHASNLKELMIAKKTGWQVLRNLKNQVILYFFSITGFTSGEPLEGFDSFVVLLDSRDSVLFPILDFSTVLPSIYSFNWPFLFKIGMLTRRSDQAGFLPSGLRV